MFVHLVVRRRRASLRALTRAACMCVAALLVSCGDSELGDLGGALSGVPSPVLGGQTGSLVPRCGVAPLVRASGVPEGEAAYVVYVTDCPEAISERAFGLLDDAGRPVDVEYEELAEGVYLVRAPGGLESGRYRVVAPGSGTTPVQPLRDASVPSEVDGGVGDGGVGGSGPGVAESAPPSSGGSSAVSIDVGAAEAPPPSLGTLSVEQPGCDTTQFRLQLGSAAQPYASLMQLVAIVDGRLSRVWVDYGALRSSGGAMSLPLNSCDFTPCLTVGAHTLTVSATIAGYEERPTASSSFRIACGSSGETVAPEPSGRSGFLACGVGLAGRGEGPSGVVVACVLLVVALAGRRRGSLA